MKLISLLKIFVTILLLLICGCADNEADTLKYFEQRLEMWRNQLKMPSFAASIVQNDQVIWSNGFGFADLEKRIPATENTIYHLASLTKPFASVILMQLVEQGKVNLNDPIAKYDINLDEAREYGMDVKDEETIQVKHLLTHTAQGVPGSYYQYSGFLFGYLTNVIEKASGKSFAELIVQNITKPLNLTHTIPNIRDSVSFSYTGLSIDSLAKYVATPYVMDSVYNIVEGEMEGYFGASAGLMSSAIDIANFSRAIDNRVLLKSETWDQVFKPTISVNGDVLPYGYGWFIQDYREKKIIWHYGYWNTNSSLILKVPEEGLTFVILANTNLLSRPFGLGGADGNVFHSPFAIEFANTFLFDGDVPELDITLSDSKLKKQILNGKGSAYQDLVLENLFAYASAYNVIGEQENAARVFELYNEFYTKSLPDKFKTMELLAQIDKVTDLAEESKKFNLEEKSDIAIFAVGEGFGSGMFDFGWIENAATGDTVWQMDLEKTLHAGGSDKNRMIDTLVSLPAGEYQLKYKSDDSHSYNRWNAKPPEIAFYGIALYRK